MGYAIILTKYVQKILSTNFRYYFNKKLPKIGTIWEQKRLNLDIPK